MLYGVNAIAVRCKLFLLLMILNSGCFAETKVFVSFSMPRTSIQQWLEQADRAKAQVYIRGFVNNSFTDTMKEAATLVKESSQEGFLLDPKSFERFHIDKVPAVVFIDDNQEPIVIYGDIGLQAAAERALAKASSVAAEKVLRNLP